MAALFTIPAARQHKKKQNMKKRGKEIKQGS